MKPILVFSPARCGSQVLMSIVRSYSPGKSKITEYFNIRRFKVIDGGDKIISVRLAERQTINNKFNEHKKRVNLLKKYNNKKIPIKIVGTQMSEIIFNYVKTEYTVVTINRKNKYDQLLSWIISTNTGVWHSDHRPNIYPKIIADVKLVDQFVKKQIELYKFWRQRFLTEEIILTEFSYEELTEDSPNFQNIINTLGFTFDDRNLIDMPQKIHTLEEKEKLIINIDEINEYINSNFFEHYFNI